MADAVHKRGATAAAAAQRRRQQAGGRAGGRAVCARQANCRTLVRHKGGVIRGLQAGRRARYKRSGLDSGPFAVALRPGSQRPPRAIHCGTTFAAVRMGEKPGQWPWMSGWICRRASAWANLIQVLIQEAAALDDRAGEGPQQEVYQWHIWGGAVGPISGYACGIIRRGIKARGRTGAWFSGFSKSRAPHISLCGGVGFDARGAEPPRPGMARASGARTDEEGCAQHDAQQARAEGGDHLGACAMPAGGHGAPCRLRPPHIRGPSLGPTETHESQPPLVCVGEA